MSDCYYNPIYGWRRSGGGSKRRFPSLWPNIIFLALLLFMLYYIEDKTLFWTVLAVIIVSIIIMVIGGVCSKKND